MTGATRQQRGLTLEQTMVRIPSELLDWLREYAREKGISNSMATTHALEAFKETQGRRAMNEAEQTIQKCSTEMVRESVQQMTKHLALAIRNGEGAEEQRCRYHLELGLAELVRRDAKPRQP